MMGANDRRDNGRHVDDDALIASLYGLDESDHIANCAECRHRLEAMEQHRRATDADSLESMVDGQLLAGQRRAIYQGLDEARAGRKRSWRWAPAGAAAIAIGVGVLTLGHRNTNPVAARPISDVDLAAQVSQLSLEAEAQPTAPLKGLFE